MQNKEKFHVHIYNSFHPFFIESSGFVYGTMSLVEKIFVGIAIMLVQTYMPNLSNDPHASVPYFKWIFSFGCGGMFIFSMIIFGILMPQKIGKRYCIFLVFRIEFFGKYLDVSH